MIVSKLCKFLSNRTQKVKQAKISTDFMMETVWASSINQPIRKTKVHWNMHIRRDYL